MPIPKPREGEEKDEFVSRCMGDDTMKEDYPEQEQRLAVCYSSWRQEYGGEPPEEAQDMGGYGFKAISDSEGEMWIYDAIGDGWFGGITAKQFSKDLQSLGKLKTLNLRINSPGGDVFDGVAIYNLLRQNRAQVRIYIDGLAASIASVIAMAGDEVYMAENAMMMIHEAWGMGMGTAKEMRDLADTLDKVTGSIHMAYLRRTELDAQKISDMMAAETWMTAAEALEHNFVDGLTEELKLAAHYDLTKFRFHNLPQPASRGSESLEDQSPVGGQDAETEAREPLPAEPEYLPPSESRLWFAKKLEGKRS